MMPEERDVCIPAASLSQPATFPVDNDGSQGWGGSFGGSWPADVLARMYPVRNQDPLVEIPGETPVMIGRNARCAVCIGDPHVSNFHCTIWLDAADEEFKLRDTSTNGTFVNGLRVGRGHVALLRCGDEVALTAASPGIGYVFRRRKRLAPDDLDPAIAHAYDLREVLGRGAFSVVRKAVCRRTGRVCAIKLVDKGQLHVAGSRPPALRELELLQGLSHPNVIAVLDAIDTPRHLCIVLEFANRGELLQTITRQGALDEDVARDAFRQMLRGVAYLHSRRIVHRDLKPENVLLHDTCVKITDFGLARACTASTYAMTTLCGTPLYVAPELIRILRGGGGATQGYTQAVDLWSLGLILYIMLTASSPFTDESGISELGSQILAGGVGFHSQDQLSDDVRDLLQKLLQQHPEDRISAAEALEHPWVVGAPDPARE